MVECAQANKYYDSEYLVVVINKYEINNNNF